MTRGTKMETIESLLARTEADEDCMLWKGFFQNRQVPMVAHGGKMVSVRKLIATLQGKKIPAGGYWTTKCGCMQCVAPAHIVHRTSKAQHALMTKALFGNPTKVAIRNAKLAKARAVLTEEQRQELRDSSESSRALAEKFGVSPTTIAKHRKGQMGATMVNNPWLQLLRLGDTK